MRPGWIAITCSWLHLLQQLVAKGGLDDLAAHGLRKLVADLEPLRELLRGDLPRAQELHRIAERERRPTLEGDHGAHPLAQERVGHRDDRDLRDRGVLVEEILDLLHADVLPAAD